MLTWACTISCPACRQAVAVRATGLVACPACATGFEVGVYSPSPCRFDGSAAGALTGISISENWLRIHDRAYDLSEVAGASLTRQACGLRRFGVPLTLLLAVAAGFGREWPLAFGFALLGLALVLRRRSPPERYVVSWITRHGREVRQSLSDADAARRLLAVLRSCSR